MMTNRPNGESVGLRDVYDGGELQLTWLSVTSKHLCPLQQQSVEQ